MVLSIGPVVLRAPGRPRLKRCAHRALVPGVVCAVLLPWVGLRAGDADRLQRVRRQLQTRYDNDRQAFFQELADLATWCDQQKLVVEANLTRRKAKPIDPAGLYLNVIPDSGDAADASTPRQTLSNDWRVRFQRLNRDYAQKLFLLARGAFRSGLYRLAFDRVREVIEYDPDHKPSRSMLGYTQYKKRWVQPFAAKQLGKRYVWDDRWGWVRKGHLERYERGLRPVGRSWLTEGSAQAHFKKWRNARDVRIEHFLIKTNAGLEHAIQLGKHLEDLYVVFFRLFIGYFAPKQQCKALFASGGRRFGARSVRSAKPFEIHYYRSRDQYKRYLRPVIREAADWSAGVYIPAQHRSCFFYDPRMDRSTVTHEATHQLFAEARTLPRKRSRDSDFWVVEGAACYMENLHRQGGRIVLGSTQSGKLWYARQLARTRKLARLRDYVGMSRQRFQTTNEQSLRLYYAQATALFHFLMEYDDGRYREQLVEYIEDIYTGRGGRDRLARRLGKSLDALEKQFVPYVVKLDIPGAKDSR